MVNNMTISGFYIGSTIGSIIGYMKDNEGQSLNRFMNIATGTTLGGCTGAILANNKTALTVILLLTTGELFYNYCIYDIYSFNSTKINYNVKQGPSKNKYLGGLHSSIYN
jgi:hypothetical protein